MREFAVDRAGVKLAVRIDGADDPAAPTIVFAHALGTSMRIWDQTIADLPDGLRIVRFDLRGHGQSDAPDGPYAMGALVADAEAICDAAKMRDALFVGLSVGGMIGQGLAIKRLDLVRALVLSNTAAKIGNAQLWQDRIAIVKRDGMPALADAVLARWFSPAFLASPDVTPWREMLLATDPEGYTGVCAAIAGTDFYTPTSGLRLPTLGIAGSEDRATPPDLVRETVDLIPGSEFRLMRKTGHLPCVEHPSEYAAILTSFAEKTGHLR
ncbi:3-oxoadipate enol-lactonase [Cognatiyoonia koreensis]|uniref:3-oxoadipate enol-lactonase n=1 Tax=Cognatiyoonia koreensis TaxID=364200 RepID=A0A1I0QR47_9RHOB|nr:3-oxoadipate enol-lactonase [Cognatiyoonia koreensis]SEW30002.1 3-oxoadipate enol-lactonase [Cognatiyoonia koreensis]